MRVRSIHVRTALFAASLLATLWGYRLLLLVHAPVVFSGVMEDLSYGWYVPLFSLYVLWRERRELIDSVGEPSVWGLLLALPFLFIGYIGVGGVQIRFEILGFVGLLIALTLAFFGKATARRALFPILFLLFCMPLHSFLDLITIHLRIFAVSVAYSLLHGCGVDIVRQGTMLASSSGSFTIDVAEPCSGLRSLFAMVALTTGYAYFTQPTWLRRWALIALSVPIAIVGNVVRILSIVIVAATCSADFATGFYHDYSGYVVFLVAVALMVAAGGLVSKVAESRRGAVPAGGGAASGAVPVEASPRPSGTGVGGWLVVSVATLLVGSVMSLQALMMEPALCEAPEVRLGELPGYSSEVVPASEAELHTLPSDTIIDKRLYTAPDGSWHLVSLIIGGRSKSSIHRPEMCLPTQGFQMSNPRGVAVGGVDWRLVTLGRKSSAPLGFAYTFFNQDGFRTSSHVRRILRDVLDRSLRRRIDRWAMVTVNSSTADERRQAVFLGLLKGVVR
ncbi:MAG: exosortase/archaeosortase family protein [Kiritimatiellae bacterium]|nr:exosortase/archaeosortase family protein [Kiritimatiellia bacterium]MBQ3343322.1 exosortase/archaeosortase family protein [Kiritimatiellia bacterium]